MPDNQEVFLYPDSSISAIVEILERVAPQTDIDAARSRPTLTAVRNGLLTFGCCRFHFASLAHDNAAQSSVIHDIKVIPFYAGVEPLSAIVLEGTQLVPKFRRAEADEVRIVMVLHRIPSKNIDIVETWNVPITSSDDDAVGNEGLAAAKADVERFVNSFKIVDFGLFA